MATEITSSISQINPNFSSQEGYELSNHQIIPNEQIVASFVPFQDLVELWAYDLNNNLIGGSDNFIDYIIVDSPTTSTQPQTTSSQTEVGIEGTSKLELNPSQDAINLGFDVGTVNTVYNFINYKLGTSIDTKYFISEISSDRTEIRLKSNYINNEVIKSEYLDFESGINNNIYVDEFYLNFGDNQYQVCINSQLDTTSEKYTVLVKLYDALPPNFSLKDEVSVVIKPAESIAYEIVHPTIEGGNILDVTFIKGPNTDLKINDFLNNSTDLQSQNDILNTLSTSSTDNLSNVLNRKGVALTPNYSYNTFDEFVNFSSAQKRIQNFVEKVTQIQSYEADISTLNTITGPTSESYQVSSSVASATTNIENLIKNFDGYEYFLYYGSGSSSYPKTGSSQPYELLPSTDVEVSTWLGSDVEGSQYYGGIALSASFFDNSNQNWLYYTIPEFIRDNGDNEQYLEFSNMVGQHFDEVWLYTKAVTEKLNTTSQLTDGVPLDLADDVIAGLGYDGFGSNFNNQDPYIGLIGENDGVYVPPTGSELITNYIAVNNGQVVNYWDLGYSFENYVEQVNTPGYPYAIDKVSKEIFKRLYHNMSYLVKKKGTISGLRQLINIWGIPNTILRINEFGGKNKDNTDDYDLWYNRYSYAFTPVSTQNVASASVVFPWMPLERNRIAESEYIVPDNLQFRFKTTGYPSSSFEGEFFTQSLAVKKSDGDVNSTEFDFGISLLYEPVATGSYSGSHSSEYEDWGKIRFHISGAAADGGVATSNDIYLPFYDKGWWSIMLQRDQHVNTTTHTTNTTYTLYAKNKINNGLDGNSIGFEGSASIVSNVSESINESWNKFGVTANDGIYLGGFISGSTVGGITTGLPGKMFSGSLQEFRYYSNDIPESTFNDFVMNPESIEGNSITGSESSFDIVNFRAPLGNELESVFTSSLSSSYAEPMTSMHPSIQGVAESLITASFVNPTGNITSSIYNVLYYENNTTKTFSKTNTEVYFLDQPSIGFRNRISNKIQVKDGSSYGNILSNRISIQQEYQISQSYTENINSLEVAFSPQDEVNDDIIASFGYGVVAEAIADPRFTTSDDSYYPKLKGIAEDYFKKYTEGNAYDYLRLIKYFDNSIFKAIKAYVPARTNVSTGIVIKQHMLERNRLRPVKISEGTVIAVTPEGGINTPIIVENIVLTASIDTINQESPTGGSGGSTSKFNYVGNQFVKQSGPNQGDPSSAQFGEIEISQSWDDNIATVVGLETLIKNQQEEFYSGEFSGSEFIATTQSLLNNPYLNPTIPTTPTKIYQNSVYYPTPNNVSENRSNTERYKVENQFGINTTSNLSQISDGTAVKAQTPNSNYTSNKVIIPRYLGSKISSADYNNYSPSSSDTLFLDGTTGSWPGDNAYGKTSVIDKNPIYFAHFQTSKDNSTLWGSYTFNIDALIEAPFDDITGTPVEPKTIKIDGSNNHLLDVSSTFEHGRKALVAYTYFQKGEVNYTSLAVGSSKIYQGGLEYDFVIGSEYRPNGFIPSLIFTTSSWFAKLQTGNTLNTSSTPQGAGSSGEGFLRTGSGNFKLAGDTINVTGSWFPSSTSGQYDYTLEGPGLGVIHSMNTFMSMSLEFGFTLPTLPGLPQVLSNQKQLNPSNPTNYWGLNPSSSSLNTYEDTQQPFIIKRGDEIRVTFNTQDSTTTRQPVYETVDFTVLNVEASGSSGDSQPEYNSDVTTTGVLLPNRGWDKSRIFNIVNVTPNPNDFNIPNGTVNNFTIRRRVNADDRVIIYQQAPSGSQGAESYSPQGYIVPDDMTITQKKNIQTMINQLQEKNAFPLQNS